VPASSTLSRLKNWDSSAGVSAGLESVDDPEVAAALLGYLEEWFVGEGCREMTGPHGFTDLDPEGCWSRGSMRGPPSPSQATTNPIILVLIEALGFKKEVDYIETRLEFPQEMPPLFQMMEKKIGCRSASGRLPAGGGLNRRGVREYAGQFWEVLEASFENLYGVTPAHR